jgi:hypothetical protein
MQDLQARVVLPHEGKAFLCASSNGRVEPLIAAPGEPDARYTLSADGHYLAVIDRNSTRAGLFELLPTTPWLRERLPLSPLPDGCKGHATLPLHDTLLVGGKGPRHEALWQRSPMTGDAWTNIALPEEVLQFRKAVDGLHLKGSSLIVVDDIVLPKWLLLYDADERGQLTHRKTLPLPHHTSYEHVIDSHLGASSLWCLSKGINHGISSTHLFRLDATTFEELDHWSARESARGFYRSVFDVATEPENDPGPRRRLLACNAMMELSGHALLACGREGLAVMAITADPCRIEDLQTRETPELERVDGFAIPAPWNGQGVFLVGADSAGICVSVWLPESAL